MGDRFGKWLIEIFVERLAEVWSSGGKWGQVGLSWVKKDQSSINWGQVGNDERIGICLGK